MGNTLKCITPGTPQKNDRIKRRFTTFSSKLWIILNEDTFLLFVRNILFAEAVDVTTTLESNSIMKSR